MQSRVFAVSIDSSKAHPHIAIYRTDGTVYGGGMKTRTLSVDRLIRLTRAMVSTAVAERVNIYDRNGWVSWLLPERFAAQILKLEQSLEKVTLG